MPTKEFGVALVMPKLVKGFYFLFFYFYLYILYNFYLLIYGTSLECIKLESHTCLEYEAPHLYPHW